MRTFLKRLFLYIPLIIAALLQNILHESVHFCAAWMFGEQVLEFRLFTNGWGTSQVIFAAPIGQRLASYWFVIAFLPALVTTLIGFLIYALKNKLLTKSPIVNIFVWYFGVMFMVIDPLYFGVLSWFIPGSDVDAAVIIGWPAWPFRVLGLVVLAIGVFFTIRWRQETQQHLVDYQLKIFSSEVSKT